MPRPPSAAPHAASRPPCGAAGFAVSVHPPGPGSGSAAPESLSPTTWRLSFRREPSSGPGNAGFPARARKGGSAGPGSAGPATVSGTGRGTGGLSS